MLALLGEPREQVEGRAFGELLEPSQRDAVLHALAAGGAPGDELHLVRFAFQSAPGRTVLATRVEFKLEGRTEGVFVALSPHVAEALADASLADLVQREARQKEKFAALLAVSHAVVNSLDLDTILNTIARQSRQVIQTEECTVFLYDEPAQELFAAACDVEAYKDEMMAVRLKLGEGITGTVAQTGRGEIVNHAEIDPRSIQVPGTPPESTSLLCVPLFDREKAVGVITMSRTGGGQYPFTDGDLELATLFAGQCSAAIANARLYEGMKKAFDELREAQAQLVLSAKLNALGEMAGGVAHDFNNILAAILGRTQLLLHDVQDPEVRRQLQVVEQAALDGANTVRRVQEFTRVRQDESFETLDVNRVLLGVVELTRPAWEAGAKRRGIAIGVELDLRSTLPLAGNASELREVFTNLVLNAVDAMPWGGHLSISTADQEREVEVVIRDDGIGMDEETCSRVFDPFFTTKQVKGTGLGLSVAYGIVTRHRGTIAVASEPNLGTQFTLAFPTGARARGGGRAAHARSAAAAARAGGGRRGAGALGAHRPAAGDGTGRGAGAGRAQRARDLPAEPLRRGVLGPRHARGERLGPRAVGEVAAARHRGRAGDRLGLPARERHRHRARRGPHHVQAVLDRGRRARAAPAGREPRAPRTHRARGLIAGAATERGRRPRGQRPRHSVGA